MLAVGEELKTGGVVVSSAAIHRSERIQKNAVKLIQKHCKRVTDLMTVTGTFFTSTHNTENFRYKKNIYYKI